MVAPSRSGVSVPTASSPALMSARKAAGLRAVVGAMVDGEDHVHHGPDGDHVALGRLDGRPGAW